LKLNGYYDVFGGLQDLETFNVGMIDVFGTDDSQSFHMDLYQTQIKLETTYVEKGGDILYSLIEFDFRGGNGNVRLRKAYVEYRHWQIGQNWNNFGDEGIWPNILEVEGPPSGIWERTPHIKYFNSFKDESWIYEISLEAPITDYIAFPDYDLNVEEAYQIAPDLTFAVKKDYDWGHIRLSSILRNVIYNYNDDGYEIKSKTFNEDGELISRVDRFRNDKGEIVKEKFLEYNEKGEIINNDILHYNKKGGVIKEE
jgi:hypothetical protein